MADNCPYWKDSLCAPHEKAIGTQGMRCSWTTHDYVNCSVYRLTLSPPRTSTLLIREAHIFVEGGGDADLGLAILSALQPQALAQQVAPKLFMHAVHTEWQPKMFSFAYTVLRAHYGVELSTTNCSVQTGAAHGKRIYMVYLK
jgi:hypothetical protein